MMRKAYIQYILRLVQPDDATLIEWLDSKDNKNQTIKKALEQLMHQEEEQEE